MKSPISLMHRSHFSRHSCLQRGFTLIELLVVISIITVLVAIITPVYSSVRSTALKAQCSSNLRQIVLGWLMYTNDHDDRACLAYEYKDQTSRGYKTEITWYCTRDWFTKETNYRQGYMSPYLKAPEQLICPVFKSMISRDKKRSGNFLGYGYNTTYIGMGYIGDMQNEIYPEPILTTQIENPTRTAAFADTAYWDKQFMPIDFLRSPDERQLRQQGMKPSNWYYSGTMHFLHRGFANVAFADGHIRAVPNTHHYQVSYPRYPQGEFAALDPKYGTYRPKEIE